MNTVLFCRFEWEAIQARGSWGEWLCRPQPRADLLNEGACPGADAPGYSISPLCGL